MADPLSISASIAGVISLAQSAISALSRDTLRHDRDYLEEVQPVINKFETAVILLQTTSKHLPSNAVVPGVDLSLKICMERGENIQRMIYEVASGSKSKLRVTSRTEQFTKRLSKEVDMFADSVASITTFSQEARTEYILRSVEELKNMSQRSLVNYDDLRVQIYEITKGPKGLHYMIDAFKALDDARARGNDDTHVAELLSQLKADMDDTRDNIDKRQEDLKEIRAQLERTFTQQMSLEFDQSDGFVYNISILSREDGVHDAASSTHCRATLDTGCHDNWVSTGIIERADLQGSVIAITDSDQFKSFSGHAMEPQGQIELTFFLATVSASSQQTRTETFYVFDQLPVDLVLGKGFIAKHFKLVSKHALGLVRQGKFTQGLYLRLDLGSSDDRDITEGAGRSQRRNQLPPQSSGLVGQGSETSAEGRVPRHNKRFKHALLEGIGMGNHPPPGLHPAGRYQELESDGANKQAPYQ